MVNFCNSDGWPSGIMKSALIQLATLSKLECVALEILQQSSKLFSRCERVPLFVWWGAEKITIWWFLF